MEFKARYAVPEDAELVIRLRNEVQAALTASGSLQEIRMLDTENVLAAITREECFVLQQSNAAASNIVGCAFVSPLDSEDLELTGDDLSFDAFPKPRLYLHTFMIRPDLQKSGLGQRFLFDFMALLRANPEYVPGTLFLDCWDGNTKLRDFYNRASFSLLGYADKGYFTSAVFYKSIGLEPKIVK